MGISAQKFDDQLDKWRRELIDFSRRNRLLNMGTRGIAVTIVEPEQSVVVARLLGTSGEKGTSVLRIVPPKETSKSEDELLEELSDEELAERLAEIDLSDGQSENIKEEEDEIPLQPNEARGNAKNAATLMANLRTLNRRADQEFMDKGIRILFLAVGCLTWFDNDGEWNSPILLFPIRLQKTKDLTYEFLVSDEDDIVFNPALREKLREDFQIPLELEIDEDDPLAVIGELATAVKKQKGWVVQDEMQIGVFSFSKDVIFQDLKNNAAEIKGNALVKALGFGSESGTDFSFSRILDEQLDKVASPSSLLSILDADSTQRQAIVAARDGKSFVLDGPPGTGKSQTIANIISELIANGKSVLFVSEKAAALEVVQKRLESRGLGSFLMPLHSQKIKRSEFAQELGRRLSERVSVPKALTDADVQRLVKNQNKLNAYAIAMNEVRYPLGISLTHAIGEHLALDEVVSLPLPLEAIGSGLTPETRIDVEDAAVKLQQSWTQIESPASFPWRGLENPKAVQQGIANVRAEISAARDLFSAAHAAATDIEDETGVPYKADFDGLKNFAELVDVTYRERHAVPADWLASDDWSGLQAQIENATSMVGKWQALEGTIGRLVPQWSDVVPEVSTVAQEFGSQLKKNGVVSPDSLNNFGDMSSLADNLEALEDELDRLNQAFRKLAESLGKPDIAPQFASIETLASAAAIAAEAHRPEAIWFNSLGLGRAQDALARLRSQMEKHAKQTAAIAEVFRPEVAAIPVGDVFASGSPEVNLNPLSSQGRANRRLLASLSVSGKVSKLEKQKFGEIRELATLHSTINDDASYRDALGEIYFQGVKTDLILLDGVLESARTVITLIGDANVEKLGGAISRVAVNAAEIASSSKTTLELAQSLQAKLATLFGAKVVNKTDLSDFEPKIASMRAVIEECQEWLKTAAPELLKLTLESMVDACRDIATLQEIDQEIETEAELLAEVLGDLGSGTTTDLSEVEASLRWVSEIRRLLPAKVSLRIAERLVADIIATPDDIAVPLRDFEPHWKNVLSHFEEARQREMTADFGVGNEAAISQLNFLDECASQIDEEISYQEACESLRSLGFGEALEFLIRQKAERKMVKLAIEKSMLGAFIEAMLDESSKVLTPIDRVQRDQLVDTFRETDRQLVNHAVARVTAATNARRPSSMIGALGVIQSEANKKRKHMRISDLLKRTSSAATDIVPCFMMSPLTVSMFIPKEFKFDAVIFDEASQLTTANAINAIYRGRQLIVAGDEKQLPPTSFFEKTLEVGDSDEFVEDDLADYESVLKQAKSGGFEEIGLRWHYRSKHEALITYSNYSFYDGNLVTYPGAIETAPDLGVEFFHVPDGVYARSGRRSNIIEAQKVVERVFYHAERSPHLSLGVVAFSVAQADEIENQLEAARRKRPELDEYFESDRLSGFFVKNLENVQGDERDIIIFSVGYGKDEHGKLTTSFGPVNRSGGWRRLNVAFTRARNRVELVSSITASDFAATGNENVNHFRRYLDYADRGIVALAADVVKDDRALESPFEEEVFKVIASWGYDVEPQVGQAGYRIDMAVRDPENPGRFALGIECDGAAYHSSMVARDRDRLRQEVLEGLGWNLYRIWGPTWYRTPETAKKELKEAIEKAISGKSRPAPKKKPEEVVVEAKLVKAVQDATTQYVIPYWPDGKKERPTLSSGSVESVSNFILKTLELEGPVSDGGLQRRVADELGVPLNADIRNFVLGRLVALLKSDKIVSLKESSSCLKQDFKAQVRAADPKDELSRRGPKDVSYLEAAAAVAHFLSLGHSMELAELERLVVKEVFLFDRVTANWKELIAHGIDICVGNGAAKRQDGLVVYVKELVIDK
jgi:very-short-patch-repair endonuclease